MLADVGQPLLRGAVERIAHGGRALVGGATFSTADGTACYRESGDYAPLVIGRTRGGARLVVIGTGLGLTNKRLDEDGNAALALNLLGADGSSLSRISTLAGGTSSVIVTDTDTGPLVPDTTYCVAVGFISTSAKALWAPAACTDGTTLQITR